MQYCSLQHQTLLPSPVTSTTGHSFCFGSISILSGAISPPISSYILGSCRPREFFFQCPIWPCSQGKNTEVVWDSLLQWTVFEHLEVCCWSGSCTALKLQTMNFQMFKLDLEKAEEPEIKLPTSAGSLKKQESSRKTIYFCFIDYARAFDCVDHNKLWKILKEMGTPDHLTCLLRNLYAGQEATVRTEHETTDWFQTGKEVHQGSMLSLCLFNLYAEYIL